MNPELSAKPLGMILMQDSERDEFAALSEAQKGYFLHWMRSNADFGLMAWGWGPDWWKRAMKKAKAQRP